MGKAENVNSQLLNRKLKQCVHVSVINLNNTILRIWVISYIAQKEGSELWPCFQVVLWDLCMKFLAYENYMKTNRFHSLRERHNFYTFHSR